MNKSKRDKIRFDVFLASVALHSALATCDRLRMACGIVNKKRLRGIGYNGSISGLSHCDDVGHIMEDGHCIATRHGEVNAISNTSREDIRGGQAIVTATPCINCLKDLIEEGIKEIDVVGEYSNSRGNKHIKKIANQRGVLLKSHNIDWAKLFQELFDLLARKGGILYRAEYKLKVIKEKLKK